LFHREYERSPGPTLRRVSEFGLKTRPFEAWRDYF
jgi:hypothetical protein